MYPDVNSILNQYKKEIRKLKRFWTQLIKTENFIVLSPETIEEIKGLGIFSFRIKVKKAECYFNKESKLLLREFINTLYGINDLKQFLSYSSISSKTTKYIEKSITDEIGQLPQQQTSEIIKNLIDDLISDTGKHEFFRLITGIELKGLQSVTFGDVELFIFGKKHYKNFKKFRPYTLTPVRTDPPKPI